MEGRWAWHRNSLHAGVLCWLLTQYSCLHGLAHFPGSLPHCWATELHRLHFWWVHICPSSGPPTLSILEHLWLDCLAFDPSLPRHPSLRCAVFPGPGSVPSPLNLPPPTVRHDGMTRSIIFAFGNIAHRHDMPGFKYPNCVFLLQELRNCGLQHFSKPKLWCIQ